MISVTVTYIEHQYHNLMYILYWCFCRHQCPLHLGFVQLGDIIPHKSLHSTWKHIQKFNNNQKLANFNCKYFKDRGPKCGFMSQIMCENDISLVQYVLNVMHYDAYI